VLALAEFPGDLLRVPVLALAEFPGDLLRVPVLALVKKSLSISQLSRGNVFGR
jgi:hypothetical protein